MTYKNGLIVGAILGFGAWAFVHGRAIFVPAPELAAGLLGTWAAIFVVLAIVMVFISAWRRRSVFSPTVDGFIYGFVAIFDLLWAIGELGSGYLPVP